MVSYHIRYLANITQNKLQLLRILILFTECDYAEKVKKYDRFILLGLSFLKSFKINLGSKGLSGIRKEPEKRIRLTLKVYHSAHKKCLMTMLIGVLV